MLQLGNESVQISSDKHQEVAYVCTGFSVLAFASQIWAFIYLATDREQLVRPIVLLNVSLSEALASFTNILYSISFFAKKSFWEEFPEKLKVLNVTSLVALHILTFDTGLQIRQNILYNATKVSKWWIGSSIGGWVGGVCLMIWMWHDAHKTKHAHQIIYGILEVLLVLNIVGTYAGIAWKMRASGSKSSKVVKRNIAFRRGTKKYGQHNEIAASNAEPSKKISTDRSFITKETSHQVVYKRSSSFHFSMINKEDLDGEAESQTENTQKMPTIIIDQVSPFIIHSETAETTNTTTETTTRISKKFRQRYQKSSNAVVPVTNTQKGGKIEHPALVPTPDNLFTVRYLHTPDRTDSAQSKIQHLGIFKQAPCIAEAKYALRSGRSVKTAKTGLKRLLCSTPSLILLSFMFLSVIPDIAWLPTPLCCYGHSVHVQLLYTTLMSTEYLLHGLTFIFGKPRTKRFFRIFWRTFRARKYWKSQLC